MMNSANQLIDKVLLPCYIQCEKENNLQYKSFYIITGYYESFVWTTSNESTTHCHNFKKNNSYCKFKMDRILV